MRDALDLFCASLTAPAVVANVGAGDGREAAVMREHGLEPVEFDYGRTGIRYEHCPMRPAHYDGIYCAHTLEHMRNVGQVLDRFFLELKTGGLLAVVVPPLKHQIVGGHLSLWNAGLLVYNLIRARFDCRDAAVASYGYNVAVLVRKRPATFDDRALVEDCGDIERLAPFFPFPVRQDFDGRIPEHKWQPLR